ncbi:TonB-dependent receptor [Litorilituus sediminis]|uniref:TonB-dependent receptor n=1 Tax=Litorilituus sediminis TaxID=718192 RepID=A0A4V0ZG87_9GAMM|nr:TonB-dependent receptor [Litorilituus sediminis]QBG36440.1 TonB-dependent receptor [Litorilituus sediminis]
MNNKKHFKLGYLSSLVMLNLGLSTASLAADSAVAEENKDEVEVIVVSGIRDSLIKSKDIKLEADTIVDAITSEDIGKFPDQNVAESLQRITGVAIDRKGGEGQLITVRGMGPEFTSVLLNGRTLATTSGGRAFSFDIFASELISGAEVFKTQAAHLQEGAIGATVNVTTFKPFDIPGFKAVGTAKAQYDEMTGEVAPQFSGLISNTTEDDKFGVLFSFAHNERKSRYDSANTAYYWHTDLTMDDGSYYDDIYFPQNYDQIAQSEERTRTNANLVLQYKPSDNLEFTADALYSQYDVEYRQDILAHWFTKDQLTDVEVDDNGTLVKLSMGKGSNSDVLVRQSDTRNELLALGFNAAWDVNSDLNLSFDVAYSEAKSDPKRGTTDTVASRPGDYTYDRSSGAQLPQLTFDRNNSASGLKAGWGERFGYIREDDVLEAKIDAELMVEAGPLYKIGFGTMTSDRTLASTRLRTTRPLPWTWGDNSAAIWLPENMFSVYDADGFLSGGSGAPEQSWLTFNSEDFFDYITSADVVAQLDDPAGVQQLLDDNDGFTMHAVPWNYEINEKLFALYTDAYLEGEIGNMLWSVTAGLRYVKTDSTSNGFAVPLLDLIPSEGKPGFVNAVEGDDYTPVTVKHDYDNWLPSINAKLEVMENLITRFAYSKSITRPELDEMSPESGYGGGDVTQLTGWGSNPKLMPFESKNLDLGIEWYYDEGSYAAIAMFQKDVDGYLSTEEVEEQVTVPSGTYNYRISRPVNSDQADIEGYELAIQHMFTSLPAPFDGLGIIANKTFVDSESTADEADNPLPLIGLGDSANLILFYEKDAIQLRVAWNQRDRFMQSKPESWRDGHYVDDYAQVDISGSYDINEHLTVFFEGINVTNELYITTAKYSNQYLDITETGPRYSVGIRGTF